MDDNGYDDDDVTRITERFEGVDFVQLMSGSFLFGYRLQV